jgi:hypothetical protein
VCHCTSMGNVSRKVMYSVGGGNNTHGTGNLAHRVKYSAGVIPLSYSRYT